MNFDDLFQSFSQLKVVILGDVMLDTYWWGNVERISPEAPVPVVALNKKELRVGGAGNVALNSVALGASTYVFSVIGEDSEGKQLKTLFENNHIHTDFLVFSSQRITTNKTRIVCRNQQMMRLDSEITNNIDKNDEYLLLENLEKCFNQIQPDVLIFEDYNKGVLTEELIEQVTKLCKEYKIITTVDPKRKNFFAYKGVDIFKPNLKEAKEALNLISNTVNDEMLQQVHTELQHRLNHKISFITLSEKGVYFQTNEISRLIPTHIRNIADVSGAGDTVIATASLVYSITKNMLLAAEIANIAGGLVCEEVGTSAINKDKLLNECNLLLRSYLEEKVFS